MRFLSVLIIVVLFSVSCKEEPKKIILPNVSPKQIERPMQDYNKEMMKLEDQQIDDYLSRRSWDFEKTATGLRYFILDEGFGIRAEEGQHVQLEYTLHNIHGELLYSSEEDGPLDFVVDKSEEVSGLHEMVKIMKLGGKAKLIVPSYLAHGIAGDGSKIGRKITLIYELQFTKIKE